MAIATWKEKYERAAKSLSRVRDESSGAIERATRTGLTMGGAFGMAMFEARFPDRDFLGQSPSVIAGGTLLAASYLGYAGKQDENIEALANGFLAVFAVEKGTAKGAEMLAAAA